VFGHVEGVEPTADLLTDNNPHRPQIYVGPFDETFRPGKQYSLILMLDVLEHLQDPRGALQQVSQLLTIGGMFLATVPAFMTLWTNHDVLNYHQTRYTKRTLREVIRDTDLRIREERYLYHWTCPLKLAVAWKERLFRSQPEPPTIPAAGWNELFFQLSRFEQKTLSRVPMPFGSSLLVVASRG
jgi:hypothetical protein